MARPEPGSVPPSPEAWRGEGRRRARAPGRVNLIGEHIDYNGLPVLPVAVDRDLRLSFRPVLEPRVSCVSTDDRFDPLDFALGETISPGPPGDWGNYLRASAQALWCARGPLRGFEGEVRSTIPIASGLSSSSALVVATALALIDINRLEFVPAELMTLLAEGERLVGTAGGGMDQAVCLAGRGGHALRVSFDPLTLDPIPFPDRWRILIASSLVPAAKSGEAMTVYNSRVRESRNAFAGIIKRLGEPVTDYRTLIARWRTDALLDLSRTALDHTLQRRFRHVLTEAARVDDAVQAMRGEDLDAFGQLMLQSHESLRDDYEVSCAELDELVERAIQFGAVGARVTGAGFGGCIVALVERGQSASVLEDLWKQFYVPRGITENRRSEVLFVARPAEGARVEWSPGAA